MRPGGFVLLVLAGAAGALGAGCGGAGGVGGDSSRERVGDLTGDTGYVAVPDVPRARRGRLVAASSGAFDLGGSWPARAGLCDQPALLQVIAGEPALGAIVLLRLPPAAERITRYPVTLPDTALPEAPAALVAVQLVAGQRMYTFHARSGEAQVYAAGERLSARLQVTLRELTTGHRVGYAAVFEAVLPEPLTEAQCRLAEAEGPGVAPHE